MSKVFLVTAIAFGLVLFPRMGGAQDDSLDLQTNNSQQKEAIQTVPLPFPVLVVEDEAAAKARQRSDEEAVKREIDNLSVQESMAESTWAMNTATQDMRDYSLYSTILVGVGTALLFVTLGLTWQANRAAVAAVDVTRSIGESQVRAYFHFAITHMDYLKSSKGDGIKLSGALINKGQSPALEVEVGGLLATSKPEMEGKFSQEIRLNLINSYCAPSVEQMNVSVTIPFSDFIPPERSGDELWFLIVLRYRDVFNKEQRAFFRGKFSDNGGKPLRCGDLAGAAEIGNVSVLQA